MFTGIIEDIGTIKSIDKQLGNVILTIECSFVNELKINQSVAHNGICLSVLKKNDQHYSVCAISETINKTNLKLLKPGASINLERALLPSGRLDGHFVQGHIDCASECTNLLQQNGSWLFTFSCKKEFMNYLSPKGSIAINGVSLTIAEIYDKMNRFNVAIIPYTFNNTNFNKIMPGDFVNLEFDIISKQIVRLAKGYL